ncbi:unnamed protein product [Camellia sinensis]
MCVPVIVLQIRHGNMANQTRKMNRKCINYGIGYLSICAKVGHWGFLENLFFEISEKSKRVQMLYLSPGRDEYYMVVAGTFCDIAQQSRSHPTSLFLQRDKVS